MLNQKGAAPILILVAIIGLVAFLAVATSAPLKNTLLSSIFPKDQSQAADDTSTSPPGSTTSFLETFDEDPKNPDGTFVNKAPTPWNQTNWSKRFDVYVLDTDAWGRGEAWEATDTNIVAHHGPDCSPPLNVHTANSIYNDVYNCRNHIMTSVVSGYSTAFLTPNAMVDFSNGEAVITWDVSTFMTSRDWWSITISPWEDSITQPQSACCNGEPKRGLLLTTDGEAMNTSIIKDFKREQQAGGGSLSQSMCQYFPTKYCDPQAAAATRQTYELRISKNHIKFGMPKLGLVFQDRNISPLDWDKGVVQWTHHAYNPQKDCTPTGDPTNCAANTWHWDNFKIEPAQNFTMIKGHTLGVNKFTSNTVNFPYPAPTNSYLRFGAVGDIQVSFDNGTTYIPAVWRPAGNRASEHFSSYGTPVPAGTTKVLIKGSGGPNGKWVVRNPQIWSQDALDPNATPIPLPSMTPTPSPTPVPTPTPSPNGTVISTIEAESGTVNAPFSVNNGLISQSIDSQSNPLNGGKLTIPFNAPVTGDYIIKGFVSAAATTNDSFFINVDQEPTSAMIWDLTATNGIQQKTVFWRDGVNPKVFNLTGGTHSIIIRGREPNAQIDKVVIEKLGAPPPSIAPSPTTLPISSVSPNPSPSQPPPSVAPSALKIGDLDGNGKVDIFDFNTILSNFGRTGSNIPSDLDGNGKVDIFDFNTLLSNFGE